MPWSSCRRPPSFCKLTAAEFFQSLVVGRLGAAAMVEGPNFFFGRDRGGDVDVLQELCRAESSRSADRGANLDCGQMISSTRIRGLLETGKVDQAARLAWRPPPHPRHRRLGCAAGPTDRFPHRESGRYRCRRPGTGRLWRDSRPSTGSSCQAAIHIGPSPTFEDDGAARSKFTCLTMTATFMVSCCWLTS